MTPDIAAVASTALSHSSGWHADAWAALGTCVAAVAAWVAVIGTAILALVGKSQVGEARKLRLAQAQPYVVAYMEVVPANPHFVDLVIHNFGTTAAMNVKFTSDPPLQRSQQGGQGGEDVWLPDVIPVLAPGQEWRTLWDFSPSRRTSGLPKRYEAKVSFTDLQSTEHSYDAILDWGAHSGRMWVNVLTVNDAAAALKKISETLPKWQYNGRGGLEVFTRSAQKADEDAVRQAEEDRKNYERLIAQIPPNRPDLVPPPSSQAETREDEESEGES